jgi:hypothetical protein
MKRHDDPSVWQNATHQRYELHSDEQNMMDMNDIGPEVLEQTDDMRDDTVAVDLAQVELIEVPAPHDDFIGGISRRLEAGSRSLPAMKIVRRCQKQSRHIRTRSILAEEIMGKDLRPTGVEVRMIMSNDKYTCSQMIYSGLIAMMTSW